MNEEPTLPPKVQGALDKYVMGYAYGRVREQVLNALAEAWDEGARASYLFERGEMYPEASNPYRVSPPVPGDTDTGQPGK